MVLPIILFGFSKILLIHVACNALKKLFTSNILIPPSSILRIKVFLLTLSRFFQINLYSIFSINSGTSLGIDVFWTENTTLDIPSAFIIATNVDVLFTVHSSYKRPVVHLKLGFKTNFF